MAPTASRSSRLEPASTNKINVGSTPQAIYPQLPLLKIKSQAIVKNAETKPKEGSIHSVAIPIWNEMSLIINVEEDPIYKRIFTISYFLNISVAKNAKYRYNFNFLLSVWGRYIRDEIPIALAKQEIKRHNVTYHKTRQRTHVACPLFQFQVISCIIFTRCRNIFT